MSTSEATPHSPRLLRSSVVVSTMTMVSRVLGLVRDIVLAHFIGAEAGADAFYMAFRIPNFFRRLFAEGAFSQAFVPVLAEYRERGSQAAVQELVDRVAGCLGSALVSLTVIAVIGAPVITFMFALGFWGDDFKFGLTADMIRITFPYLALISMTGFAGAILNSYGRFAVPSFTPVLLNVALISAALLAAPWWNSAEGGESGGKQALVHWFDPPVTALAWGVLAAGVVQFAFQLPFLWRINVMPVPKIDWHHDGVKRVLQLMVPALFGVSVSQINLLLDSMLASFLPTGSISWLYYSDRLSELPLGVFAIAIATVILPTLSRHHAGNHSQQFTATLDWALRMIFLIAVPATLALLLLAEPILITLFQDDKFTVADATMSSFSLRAYCLGLLAFMLVKVLAPGYFARQDTKTPVKIGVVAMVSNMVLNIMFVVPLYFYYDLGHMGLALATSVAAYLNAYLLFRGLRKSGVYQLQPGWWKLFLQLIIANGSMVAVLWLLHMPVAEWVEFGQWQRALNLGLLCGAGFLAYAGALLICGLRLRHLRAPGAVS